MGWDYGRRRAGQAPVQLAWMPGIFVALALPLAWIFTFAPRDASMLEHLNGSGILSLFGGRKIDLKRYRADLPFVFAAGTFPWQFVALGAFLNWLALRKSTWRLSPTGWLLLAWTAPTILLVALVGGAPLMGYALGSAPAFSLWLAGHGNWKDASPTPSNHGIARFWCEWGHRVSLLCALGSIVSPLLAISAAFLTFTRLHDHGFSVWLGPTLGALALGTSFAIFGWTRRPGLAAAHRWPAFEEAAGVALATLGISLWLILGWQLDPLIRLFGFTWPT